MRRTILRKKMHDYKRQNQRFDARLARIHRVFSDVKTSKLIDEELGRQYGFVIRFNSLTTMGHITSYQLMHCDKAEFEQLTLNKR